MIVGDSGQPLQLGHESERVQWLLALSRGDFASVNLKHRKWPQSKRHDSVGARGFNIGCGWLDSPMQFGVYQPSVVKPQITLGADVNTALAASAWQRLPPLDGQRPPTGRERGDLPSPAGHRSVWRWRASKGEDRWRAAEGGVRPLDP